MTQPLVTVDLGNLPETMIEAMDALNLPRTPGWIELEDGTGAIMCCFSGQARMGVTQFVNGDITIGFAQLHDNNLVASASWDFYHEELTGFSGEILQFPHCIEFDGLDHLPTFPEILGLMKDVDQVLGGFLFGDVKKFIKGEDYFYLEDEGDDLKPVSPEFQAHIRKFAMALALAS